MIHVQLASLAIPRSPGPKPHPPRPDTESPNRADSHTNPHMPPSGCPHPLRWVASPLKGLFFPTYRGCARFPSPAYRAGAREGQASTGVTRSPGSCDRPRDADLLRKAGSDQVDGCATPHQIQREGLPSKGLPHLPQRASEEVAQAWAERTVRVLRLWNHLPGGEGRRHSIGLRRAVGRQPAYPILSPCPPP